MWVSCKLVNVLRKRLSCAIGQLAAPAPRKVVRSVVFITHYTKLDLPGQVEVAQHLRLHKHVGCMCVR